MHYLGYFFLIQTTILVNIFLVVFALYLSIKYNLLKSLIAIFLMVICLGAYASMLSTIAIVVLGRMLNEWLFEKTSIKELIKNYTVTFINVLVSVIIFKLIWMYYTHTGVIQADSYNFASITLADVPTKLELVLKTMLEMFYVPQPYISTTFKLVMAIPLIASIFYIVQNKKDKFGLGILFVVAILFSSQFSTFLAKTNFAHTARIDFFSLPFLFTLFMIICLKAGKQYKNLAIIIMLYAFVQNTYADARYQKVNYLGRKAEMLVYEDIISRIKSNNNFERNKQYIMITAGTYPMRPTYYHYNKYSYEGINADLLYNEHIAKWDEKAFYNFYEPTNYVRDNYKLDRPINFMPSKDIVEDISDYILHKAQPYPHKNSVYVKGNYIYVIYSESGLKTAQHNIKQYLKDE